MAAPLPGPTPATTATFPVVIVKASAIFLTRFAPHSAGVQPPNREARRTPRANGRRALAKSPWADALANGQTPRFRRASLFGCPEFEIQLWRSNRNGASR